MDEAKVLELARAAGMEQVQADGLCLQSADGDGWVKAPDLLAFARLVAAAEREACAVDLEDAYGFDQQAAAAVIRSRTE